MKRYARWTMLLTVMAALGGLVAVGAGWSLWADEPQGEAQDKPKAETEEKPEVKKIPIDQMYTTREHEGMKWPWHRKDAPRDAKILEQVATFRGGTRVGASNVFLVRGRSFEEAVRATHRVFFSGVGVDVPALPEQLSRATPVWLVAYFGEAHSDPLKWEIRSVKLQGKSVEVAFVQPPHLLGTADIAGYMFWIPLGELEPGKYRLTLFDAEQEEVVLMRQVLVAEGP